MNMYTWSGADPRFWFEGGGEDLNIRKISLSGDKKRYKIALFRSCCIAQQSGLLGVASLSLFWKKEALPCTMVPEHGSSALTVVRALVTFLLTTAKFWRKKTTKKKKKKIAPMHPSLVYPSPCQQSVHD